MTQYRFVSRILVMLTLALSSNANAQFITVSGNQISFEPDLSASGRFISFSSFASNLVPNDTNNASDIFVYDRSNAAVTLISETQAGVRANASSVLSAISDDANFVAFTSRASNFGIPVNTPDENVYVKSLQTGALELVSVSSANVAANALSAEPDISADGRFVMFTSFATNLTGYTGTFLQVYVRDRTAGTTELISVNDAGDAANDNAFGEQISSDGRFVLFTSEATNLGPVSSGNQQAFLHDRDSGGTIALCVNNAGEAADESCFTPRMTAGAEEIIFDTFADNLGGGDSGTQLFVRNRAPGTLQAFSFNDVVSAPSDASISANGRYIAFVQFGTDAVDEVWMVDRQENTLRRISEGPNGEDPNDESEEPIISADGSFVVFSSDADNLVSGDNNNFADIFLGVANDLIFADRFGDNATRHP